MKSFEERKADIKYHAFMFVVGVATFAAFGFVLDLLGSL